MIKKLFSKEKYKYSDMEVIFGLQCRDKRVEEWFYYSTRKYFNDCFHFVFFDLDKRQEIFQSAFLKLWQEISNQRIKIYAEQICRQQKNGDYVPMTCSLNTFLMSFARTEFRELVRNVQEDNYANLLDSSGLSNNVTTVFETLEDVEEQKNRIIDECIFGLSPRCAEILTLFYYQGMKLDDILQIRGEKTQSKNGLKTAKNKCMNILKERIKIEFKRYHLSV